MVFLVKLSNPFPASRSLLFKVFMMDKWNIYRCQQIMYMCLSDTGVQHS